MSLRIAMKKSMDVVEPSIDPTPVVKSSPDKANKSPSPVPGPPKEKKTSKASPAKASGGALVVAKPEVGVKANKEDEQEPSMNTYHQLILGKQKWKHSVQSIYDCHYNKRLKTDFLTIFSKVVNSDITYYPFARDWMESLFIQSTQYILDIEVKKRIEVEAERRKNEKSRFAFKYGTEEAEERDKPATGEFECVMHVQGDAVVVLGRSCEMFVKALTRYAWDNTVANRGLTIEANDVDAVLDQYDIFDFLVPNS